VRSLIRAIATEEIPELQNRGMAPLSFAQRGLWLLDKLDPGSDAYNVPVAVQLNGLLDVVAGEPFQQVASDPGCALEIVDMSAVVPPARQEREARGLVDGWAAEPFDLASGPLVRARLIRLAEDRHVLVVVLHHTVCDGPSLHLLFDELADRYAGAAAPPPLPVQYRDYAAWQRGRPADEGALDWWRDHLAGAPTVLALPTDRPRPAVRRSRGATEVCTVPRALTDAAAALGRVERATPFMVLLAAYAALLGRLTHAPSVLIGTPVGGRTRPDLEPLIGFFVTTLPVRVDLAGDPTFAELVNRVRGSLLAVLAHQDVPFETLVERLRIERSPSHTPLVQTVFTFEPRPLAEPRFAGVEAQLLEVSAPTAKFDLDLMIVQSADGDDFDLVVNYSTEVFDASTVAALADRFRRLLTAGVAEPSTPLWALPVLTEDESSTIVDGWSSTGAARPGDRLVHELFADQAAATPEAPAVGLDGDTVTYGELDRQANRLAHLLRSRGVGADDVVGLLLPRGVDLIVGVLGILKAGAAYLPLDPIHPAGHVARVLATADAELVLTASDLAHRVRDSGAAAVCLDRTDLDGYPDVAPTCDTAPENLAYVIFTSGSTGAPKGVAIPHRALVNHALTVRDRFALGPVDRVLQFANIAFDVAAEELFPTWLAGGCVVLCPDPLPPPSALLPVLSGAGVTVANLPSSYWQLWVATLDFAALVATRLRLLVTGSEAVDAAALATWCAASPIPVISAYGLTETTITAVLYPVDAPPAGTVPIGRPIDGVEAYVLDRDMQPVPAGVAGELHIGGVGLARGYLDRPELTADRFVPNPYSTVPGARLHRTGDMARWRPDGVLEVLGRIDGQLKVHGYRIEPGEVEAALGSHPDITQAVAVARAGADGERRLVGYVVPRVGDTVPADLRRHVADRLPAYMVPSALVGLAELPMTTNGKVDRAALPEPSTAVARSGVPAGTDLQRRIVAVWQQALDLPGVGIHDNFFDLGGTSFTLAAVHKRLADVVDTRLPMVALYEHPTVAALAQHLSGAAAPHREGPGPAAAAPDAHRLRVGRTRLARRRSTR
jgi:amino acid adenylation domain-containing protein